MGMMFVSAENRAHVGTAANIGTETTVLIRWPITIGSAGVTDIMLADLGWYRPSTAEVNIPNSFTCVKAAFERGAVFQPIFKNGSRTWVINPGDNDTQPGSTNGSALVTASQFGIANFTQGEVIWFRGEFSFAASASMPCSDRVTTHVTNSQVRSFNPANTAVTNGVDSTGVFTFTGTNPTARTLGYCPWFIGNFVVGIEPKVVIGDGDSIMQSTGDTSFCPVGRGMFQRMLYGDGSSVLAGCNLARAGSFMYDLHNSTKMQYWMTKANILWTQPGTNDFSVNPGTTITAATGISRVVTTCTLARSNGIKIILRSKLGCSTTSASGNWLSDADQTTVAAWGAGGRIPDFNAEIYKLVDSVIDGVIRLDWWRSPTDQYKFKSNGTNKYATIDGVHYSILGSQQLGLEARADVDMVEFPISPSQTVTLNLSYRDPEADLLESNPISDTTPNPFTFTDQTGVALDSDIESNTVTITGITAPSPISIAGGSYKIGAGSYTTSPGNVNNNNVVRVRVHSSASNSTPASCTLTVGGVSDTFTVTTVASGGAYAPAILVDFNGLSDGQSVANTANDPGSVAGKRFDSVPGDKGFFGGFGVRASTAVVRPGKTSSLALSIAAGSDGDPAGGDTGAPYGSFGGNVSFPVGTVEGTEIWWAQWCYFPNTWEWDGQNPQTEIKFMRLDHDEATDHLDIYILNGQYSYYGNGDSSAVGPTIQSGFYFANEFDPKAQEPYTKMTSTGIPLGQWSFVQQYAYLHSDPLLAKRRLWIDGVFVREQVGDAVKWRSNTGTIKTGTLTGGCKTLQSPSDFLTQIRLFTYWNNYAPQDQVCYVSAIAIENNAANLTAVDEFGNLMIDGSDI